MKTIIAILIILFSIFISLFLSFWEGLLLTRLPSLAGSYSSFGPQLNNIGNKILSVIMIVQVVLLAWFLLKKLYKK